MIISLMGISGSGTDRIGRLLSEKRGIPFFSSDETVEKENGATPPSLLREKGETAFRRMERNILLTVLDKRAEGDLVFVCGDGMPLSAYMSRKLREETCPVWIKKSIKKIAEKKENYAFFPYEGDRAKYLDGCISRYRAYEAIARYTLETESDKECVETLSAILDGNKE